MADFGKINPEKAQQIISALKDGKINPKEMEKLGLTAEEAKALNEAFSSGQVEVGDFVLVNKGQIEKDGKKVQLSSTRQKKSDQAQENDSFFSMKNLKKVGKYAGGAVLVVGSIVGGAALLAGSSIAGPLGLTVAGGLLLASCGDKNDFDKEVVSFGKTNTYDLSTKVDQNVNIPITVPTIDYTPYFNTLITQLNELKNDQASNFKLVIEGLNAIFKKQNATADDIEAIVNNLRKVLNNQQQQIQITTKNGQDAKAFGEQLMAILVKMQEIMKDTKLSVEQKTEQISALLNEIGGSISNIEVTSADTNKTVHSIYEKIDSLKGMYDDSNVIAAINNLAAKGDTTNALLGMIYDQIGKLGGDAKAHFGNILKAIVNNGGKLDDLKKLLEAINNNIKQGNAQAKDLGERTIAAIDILGLDVSDKLMKIYNKIPKNNDYSVVLDGILAELKGLKADNNNNFANVIAAIGNKEIPATDLTWLKDNLDAILAAIKDHDVKVTVEGGTCKCSCSEGSKHEGIIGNLNTILG